MKTYSFAGIFFFGIVYLLLNSIFPPEINETFNLKGGPKYEDEWAKIDSLQKIGLPKSALIIVEEIYADAKKNNNNDQILKSYIYRLNLRTSYEEDAIENLILELEADVKTASFPNNAVMHFMFADMYWDYYQDNRYKIQNRTNILNHKPEDIQTWTTDNFIDACIKHYSLSLENAKELQNTDIKTYDEIIKWGTKPENLRPTLYDFLAHKAIDFYSKSEITLSRPADYFQITENFYLGKAENFANQTINSKDTLSLHYNGILILQDLLKFRLADKENIDALIDADLRRISYVYEFFINPNKESLYLEALLILKDKYKTANHYPAILLAIAKSYLSNSDLYNYKKPETHKYKYYKKKAHTIFEEIINNYPKTEYADQSLTYKFNISEDHLLSFKTEKIILPRKKFSARIDYKNIDKLYIKVASISQNKYEALDDKYWGKNFYKKILETSKEVYSFEQKLRLPT